VRMAGQIVIAGHSRPKDGVASARLCPATRLILRSGLLGPRLEG
jgi:hypothetical protein